MCIITTTKELRICAYPNATPVRREDPPSAAIPVEVIVDFAILRSDSRATHAVSIRFAALELDLLGQYLILILISGFCSPLAFPFSIAGPGALLRLPNHRCVLATNRLIGRLRELLRLVGFDETTVAHFTVSELAHVPAPVLSRAHAACFLMFRASATAWKSGLAEVCLINRIRNLTPFSIDCDGVLVSFAFRRRR